ncbi:hypothetical protein HTG_06445 [Natrinema mahii]|nr:hypothetical protein HTG_06445 [Natrinema mahii]
MLFEYYSSCYSLLGLVKCKACDAEMPGSSDTSD